MSELWIDGLNAATTYGFRLSRSEGVRDLPTRRLDPVTIPNRPGALLLADPAIEPRAVTLRGVLRGTSAADVRQRRDRFFAVLRRGVISIRLADSPTRELAIELTSVTLDETSGPAMLARDLPITISAVAIDPYWRDLDVQEITLTTTPAPLPLGTAPVLPVLTIPSPGAVLIVTLRSALGDTITALQLAGLVPGIPLTIDCPSQRLLQGAISVMDTLIAGTFPTLDVVTQGDFEASAWPTLALSQGSGVAAYLRRWV